MFIMPARNRWLNPPADDEPNKTTPPPGKGPNGAHSRTADSGPTVTEEQSGPSSAPSTNTEEEVTAPAAQTAATKDPSQTHTKAEQGAAVPAVL
jgi:hypothetical protein